MPIALYMDVKGTLFINYEWYIAYDEL